MNKLATRSISSFHNFFFTFRTFTNEIKKAVNVKFITSADQGIHLEFIGMDQSFLNQFIAYRVKWWPKSTPHLWCWETATDIQNITMKQIPSVDEYEFEVSGIKKNFNHQNNFEVLINRSFHLSETEFSAEEDEAAKSDAIIPDSEISHLEIRVGKILEIWRHESADRLYVEMIDIGENAPRTIISGLVKHCTEEELLGKEVIVVCNLKPRKFVGVSSYGMVLCVSNYDKSVVKPIEPPKGCKVGELITFQSIQNNNIITFKSNESLGNRASKAFERVAPCLQSFNPDNFVMFNNLQFITSQGPCKTFFPGRIS